MKCNVPWTRGLVLLGLAMLSTGESPAADTARGPASTAARPNIIFLLAGDPGYGDIGAYGQKKIRTPHLDQLAKDGMRSPGITPVITSVRRRVAC